jgi:hypothetical protein
VFFSGAILYLSILYIIYTIALHFHSMTTITDSSSFASRIIEFHKTIPLVIGAVSIGVCTVNRTTIKWMIHLAISTLIAFVFQYFSNLFVTSFLFSSFAYVMACASMTQNMDAFLKISMTVGFSVLGCIDMYTTYVTNVIPSNFYVTYFLSALISGLMGIFGVFIVKMAYPNNKGKDYLYDLKGCSCEDCANANQCSKDSNGPRRVLMRRV